MRIKIFKFKQKKSTNKKMYDFNVRIIKKSWHKTIYHRVGSDYFFLISKHVFILVKDQFCCHSVKYLLLILDWSEVAVVLSASVNCVSILGGDLRSTEQPLVQNVNICLYPSIFEDFIFFLFSGSQTFTLKKIGWFDQKKKSQINYNLFVFS